MRRLFLAALLFAPGPAGALETGARPRQVLIVMDERPPMEALAKVLQPRGIVSTIVDQKSLPEDWSRFDAVIDYIHFNLREATERKIVDYTKAGGRYVCLHHAIGSPRATNTLFFDFLGIQLPAYEQAREPSQPGGHYAWRDGVDLTVVNLQPGHYITSHEVAWPEKIAYRPSDSPSAEREYPALTLKHAEVYLNHEFTDGREKTVLLGFRYVDDRNGALYMQDREGWLKPSGKGFIVYLQMGHSSHDLENPVVAQIIANAVTWRPGP
jgi:hypothetical protein